VAARIRLELVTPTRRLIDIEVDEVRLPAALGEMGVLPGHTPLLTSLGTGPLTYTDGGKERAIAVARGFAEVLDDRVTVLADLAEPAEDIDVAAARATIDEVGRALATATAEELEELTARMRLAETRVAVATGAPA
jgi:F-type H+-transporting ATPase subunit epsilon